MKFSLADLNPRLRQRTGPLTSELVLEPGRFGLGKIPTRQAPDATTRMVCGFCSTGCGLQIHLRNGEAINLTADPEYPVNLGMACPKGWEALTPLSAPDRGTTPLLNGAPIEWPAALREFCERFKATIAKHGPESIAFISSGQICTEEMALLGCLFKYGMGGLHCDSNTRQCMATTHVAYKQSFGFDAPPFTYADFEESDVLIFIGANPCIAHPIMWQRVMRNRHKPEIIVIDPRHTETAAASTQHYAIRPKSDLTFLYGLANLLIQLGVADLDFINAHTAGFKDFAKFVEQFSVEHAAAESGLSPSQIRRVAKTIARGKRVSFWWTMGVNQSHESTRTAQAIINLALLTGNIGRPGTGANSITGQCNAMGSRLYSNITNLIGGHDFAKTEHRSKVASILGIEEASIQTGPNLAYDQIIDAIDAGKIKALWIIGTNTAHSWVNQKHLAETFAKLDFLVAQDMYPTTETAQMAHLYLPAAGWGEKEGTLINSERRIGLVQKVRRAPGQALADFHIFKLIANEWGCAEMFREWTSPEAAFQIMKKLSAGQPCDMTGVDDYQHLNESAGIQWPLSKEQPLARERRLFEDGQFYTPDKRARFIFDAPRRTPYKASLDYPIVLMTGRGTSAQWHTGSRTNKSDVLRAMAPAECYIELNPSDASRHKIKAGARVKIGSARGEISANAVITPTVPRGHAYIPMHYPEVNRLTNPVFDPHSRQPSYKHTPIRIAAE